MSSEHSLAASVATIDSTAPVLPDETKPQLKKVVFVVGILGVAQFVVFLSAFVPSSFFPNKAREKGLTGLQTGWIMGVLHLVVFIAVYIELKMMQIISPKKQLICGLIFSGISCIAFGFAYMIENKVAFLVLQLVIRIIHGAALGATDVSSFVLTNMITPIQYLSFAMAVLEGLLSFALLVSAPLGAFLLQAGGYQSPFIVAGGLCILYAIVVYLWVEEMEYKETTGVMFAVKNTVTPRVLYYLYAFMLYGALLGFFASMLEPKLREFNLTLSQVGLAMMISNGVQAIAFPISGQLCDRTGKYTAVSITSYVIVIIGMLMFGPFPGLVSTFQYFSVFIVSVIICAIGMSALSVSIFLQCKIQLINMGFNENIAGSLVSVSYLGFANMGITLGDFLGGLFIDYMGYRYGAVLWAVLMLFGIVFQLVASYCNRTLVKTSVSGEEMSRVG